jgi:galactokinase
MRRRAVAFAPGRVNLIGEHTDYNGGLALPFAIERGVTVTATALDGDVFEAHALDLGETDRFALDVPGGAASAAATNAGGAGDGSGDDGPDWRAFVRGAVAELQADDLPVRAARLEITGTVERGAGLSSSAALAVALCVALLALSAADDVDRLRLARICSRVENDWVGAPTGLLDQLASLHGREGHALRIDFRDLSVQPVPLDLAGWTLVVADSGERHAHTAASGYAERRRECAQACAALGVASLREVGADVPDLPDPLARRVRHVVEENARVDATVAALQTSDLQRVGALLDASHASLRDLYDASTPTVERTVAALRQAGAAGARMVGGGFGGHVLALLPPGVAPPPGATAVTPAAGARLVG